MVDLVEIRMRLSGGRQVAAEAEAANAAMAKTGATAQASSRRAATASASLSQTLKRQGAAMRTIGGGMTKYLTVPILGVAAVTGKMAVDFDRNMRNVNSIAQLPEAQFERIKQSVLDLAGPTAQAPNTLAEGLYDIVSSGFNASDGLKILHASALGASAGLTTTETSTKAVTAVLNAYHLEAGKAGAVTDALFETVNRGVLTFDELASSVGDVLPFASQLGININEVGAAISTMTKQGLSAPESVTRLKNAMIGLIKPSKPLKELLKEMGTTGEELVSKRGFQGALEAIVNHTDGTKEALAELFPNIRGLGGLLSLTGKNVRSANEDLDAFQNTAGATKRVLREQEKSVGFQLQRAWASLSAVLIEIGEEVLPIVIPFFLQLVGYVKDAAKWFADLDPTLQKIVLGFLGLVAVAGPVLFFVGTLLTMIEAAGVILAALVSPAALIVYGLIALGVAAYYAYQHIKPFRDVVDAVFQFVKANWRWLGPLLIAPFLPIAGVVAAVIIHLDWLKNAFNNVVRFFQRLPGRVWAGLRALPRLIGRLIVAMVVLWATLPFKMARFAVQTGIKVVAAIIQWGPSILTAALHAGLKMLDGLKAGWEAVHEWVNSLPGTLASWIASLAGQFAQIGATIASEIASGFYEALPEPIKGAVGTGAEIVGGGAEIAGDVGGFIGGVFGGNAKGTEYWRGGVTLVGEEGPELVNLPRGSKIHPSARTERILSGRYRGGGEESLHLGALQSGRDGEPIRMAVPLVVKVGKRKLLEALAEAQEDVEARE